MPRVLAVFEPQLLIDATAFAGSSWLEWPRVPPITSNVAADCLGVIASSPQYDHDVALILSDTLLAQTAVGLVRAVGLSARDVTAYVRALVRLAELSGGGVASDPPPIVAPTPDEAIAFALARARHAVVVKSVSNPPAGASLWAEAVPIVGADWFRRRVDAMRRAAGPELPP